MPAKLYDLGKSYDESMPSKEMKNKKSFPCLYLSGKDLPEIPTDGSEFFFVAKGRVAGSQNRTGQAPSMDVEVLGMAPLPHNAAAKLVDTKSAAEAPEENEGSLRETMNEMMNGEDAGEED